MASYETTDTSPPLTIIYQDSVLMAIYKPPGLLSQPDNSGDIDVHTLCRQHLAGQTGTSAYAGLLHRLDRPVSGLMILGTDKAASRSLSKQFKQGTIQKTYLAVVEGSPSRNGVLSDYLKKHAQQNTVEVVSAETEGAKHAELAYQRLQQNGNYTLLKVHPITGRSHQIRRQLAHKGFPVVGDQKYGSETTGDHSEYQIALHACRLTFTHPNSREESELTALPPQTFPWSLFHSDIRKEL